MPNKATLVHFPDNLLPLMDRASSQINPDRKRNRSMFIRVAVTEKLERMGVKVSKPVPK